MILSDLQISNFYWGFVSNDYMLDKRGQSLFLCKKGWRGQKLICLIVSFQLPSSDSFCLLSVVWNIKGQRGWKVQFYKTQDIKVHLFIQFWWFLVHLTWIIYLFPSLRTIICLLSSPLNALLQFWNGMILEGSSFRIISRFAISQPIWLLLLKNRKKSCIFRIPYGNFI